MKASTILKAIGLLFVFIGAVTGAALLVSRPSFGPAGSGIAFALFFMAMFCGIGGFFAFIGFRMDGADRKILKNGDVYLGKIQDHRPDYRVTINGAPAISLVVRYFRRGEVCEAVVNTGEADPARYPVGSTVSVSIYQNRAALVPGSVSDMTIEREEDLLNPDFNPGTNVSSIGVRCPNCGANLIVPYGMSRICPYCDSKVSVSADGAVMKM